MASDSASNFSVGACPRGECSKPKDVSVVGVAFAFAFDLQFWHFCNLSRRAVDFGDFGNLCWPTLACSLSFFSVPPRLRVSVVGVGS